MTDDDGDERPTARHFELSESARDFLHASVDYFIDFVEQVVTDLLEQVDVGPEAYAPSSEPPPSSDPSRGFVPPPERPRDELARMRAKKILEEVERRRGGRRGPPDDEGAE